MLLNAFTSIAVHDNDGTATTFVGGPIPDEIQTPGSHQQGEAVLLPADGTGVVLAATIGPVAAKYGHVPGYSRVRVTAIDNGVGSTNTSLSSADDTSGARNNNLTGHTGPRPQLGDQLAGDFLDRMNSAEGVQIAAPSGGYVIAGTTVGDNIGPVDGNLYLAVFNSAGQPINNSNQVVGSPH